ncbi:MAG: hypothetical protein COY58_05875 [Gammaproteobacteria bacterium CG_4_10_14_0_8_um_filter_38_16]|nr:MAG: hypothetical protein COY58_05875 [Gammaproteobacteria bacterium CG_4_10_14_0_8_um_filter_38_16]PJA04415.1 MAG: hypothetical protein COX72_00485 [Gammaproteobacteria bacterium CG_4_10_14_0_2_um_filter_38_22]PJB10163.1 MAG: hypothetical protein CO120_06095 [Gammaproteobacteria bacterium CG_4_9_14_3_um_filter_38_9]
MQPLIEFNHTDFKISRKNIIHNINLSISPGDFIVVLGGNGSGKSTLLKLLNRTYRNTSGNITFHQKKLSQYDEKELRQKMVTITQYIGDSIFLDLTIEENAILIESSYLKSAHQHFDKKQFLIALPNYLKQFNPKLAELLKSRTNCLSGGEQQILAFALYLRHQPDLLLLDEHTSALDPKKSDAVMTFTHQFILQKHITCLMTTHQLDYALKYGNRLIALRDGEVVFEANAREKAQLVMSDLLKYCY